jgi:hypothetical protein
MHGYGGSCNVCQMRITASETCNGGSGRFLRRSDSQAILRHCTAVELKDKLGLPVWESTYGHNFIQLSPSWEAASCAITQELPNISWNPKVHYRVHKSSLSWIQSIRLNPISPRVTLWSWVLLERSPVVRTLDSFPKFYGTRRFNTEFTRLYPEPDQFNPHHPTLSFQDPS